MMAVRRMSMATRRNRSERYARGRRVALSSVLIPVGVCIATQIPGAQVAMCTQSTLDRLEAESDGIRDWSHLRTLHHRYRACRIDDAEVTTGVSESVARMLADNWNTLPAGFRLFKQDSRFEAFAMAGLNITDSTHDLNPIDQLAKIQCPADLHVLCQRIRRSIHDNK